MELGIRSGFLSILVLLLLVSASKVHCYSHVVTATRYVIMQIHLRKYSNPSGKSMTEDCPGGMCNLKFTLYFTAKTRGDIAIFDSPNARGYAKQIYTFDEFKEYKASAKIQSDWTDGVKIEMKVENIVDHKPPALFDFLELAIKKPPVQKNLDFVMSYAQKDLRGLLYFDYLVFTKCTEDYYYGPMCLVSCEPPKKNGHYTCTETGQKKCKKGWLDPQNDCNRVDECTRGYCKNGGTCLPLDNGKYDCVCPPYNHGERCENDVKVCTEANKNIAGCLNGGKCEVRRTKIICDCPKGYSGLKCEKPVDLCRTNHPCKNSGTCENIPGGYTCRCPEGLGGSDCGLVCGRDVDCTSETEQGDPNKNKNKIPKEMENEINRDKAEQNKSRKPERMFEEEFKQALAAISNNGAWQLPGSPTIFLGTAVAMASCLWL